MLLLAGGCAGCDPVSKINVAIDSPTTKGMDCAIQALRAEGLSTSDVENTQDVTVQAGSIYMGLHARHGGYDIYTSRVGNPHTCTEIERFSPYMRRAVKAVSALCSGPTPPIIKVKFPAERCGVRVDG